jgi:hypothetical protein
MRVIKSKPILQKLKKIFKESARLSTLVKINTIFDFNIQCNLNDTIFSKNEKEYWMYASIFLNINDNNKLIITKKTINELNTFEKEFLSSNNEIDLGKIITKRVSYDYTKLKIISNSIFTEINIDDSNNLIFKDLTIKEKDLLKLNSSSIEEEEESQLNDDEEKEDNEKTSNKIKLAEYKLLNIFTESNFIKLEDDLVNNSNSEFIDYKTFVNKYKDIIKYRGPSILINKRKDELTKYLSFNYNSKVNNGIKVLLSSNYDDDLFKIYKYYFYIT